MIANTMSDARTMLGQQPEPVEHRMFFQPLDAIAQAVDKAAATIVEEDRDNRREAREDLFTSEAPLNTGDVIDPMTLPIAERAAHGHRIERYTQQVEGYGAVKVINDYTTGETQIEDPAYIEWRDQQDRQGDDQ